MDGIVDQLNKKQPEMTGLSGKPTLNEVAMETQNAKTGEVNTIEK